MSACRCVGVSVCRRVGERDEVGLPRLYIELIILPS